MGGHVLDVAELMGSTSVSGLAARGDNMSVIRKSKKRDFYDRTYPDVMVDLETMGTETDAQVLSIGAVRYRLDTVDDIRTIMDPDRCFYARLDLEDQESKGRTVSADTLEWWADQSDEARSVFAEDPEDVRSVLKRFIKFCSGGRRIWGNGNMFDNAIMRSICKNYGLKYPVGYWNDLDVRTLTRLWNLLVNKVSKGKRPTIELGEEHNALDDARRQVIQCQHMYRDLSNNIRGSRYEL